MIKGSIAVSSAEWRRWKIPAAGAFIAQAGGYFPLRGILRQEEYLLVMVLFFKTGRNTLLVK